jgi:hypothetical protein
MATIHDLNTSISDLSDEDALSLIIERRESRFVPKKSSKPKKTSPKRSPKVESLSADALLSSMSKVEKEALLMLLKGKMK